MRLLRNIFGYIVGVTFALAFHDRAQAAPAETMQRSGEGDRRDKGDVAPGVMDAAGHTIREDVLTYVIGVVLAAALTVGSFLAVHTNWIWGPGIPVALAVLAIAQMGVHLVFFLHLTTAPDNTNTAIALAFGTLIIVLVFGGSLWIMDHLDHRMMYMPPI